MGCCSSTKNSSESFLFLKKIQEAIERCNLKLLYSLWKSFPGDKSTSPIDEPIFTIHEIRLSPLAYALWTGKQASFQFIHKKLGASLKSMEKLLINQGKSALEILCMHGSLEVLQYYLPYYLESCPYERISVLNDESVSVDFQRSTLVQTKIGNSYTPVQLACEHGHLNVISYVFGYFRDRLVPFMLDIGFQDESSGENCALIACRKGDYKMVKLLHEVCKADFSVLNRRGENAILIAAASSKRNSTHDFYHLFVYLVEVVRLDFISMHEEVILLLEDRNIIRFYENKLKKQGIRINKKAVEKKFEISKPDYPVTKEQLLIEQQGENFQVKKCIEESGDNTKSILSSIHGEDRSSTPFMSTITI